ncbi:MAG: glutaredoxin, partial [Gammaproteobacteria bacterium]|nr:glutaredoxin [Gammaproteobacteria bacterium]
MNNPVNITVFRWAGAWGPFKVKIPCGECSLTKDIIQDCIDSDLQGLDVELELRDWLTEW